LFPAAFVQPFAVIASSKFAATFWGVVAVAPAAAGTLYCQTVTILPPTVVVYVR
jgi:hypothetical protein